MAKADDFRAELARRLRVAEQDGRRHIDINAGELHRTVGGYPQPEPRMPMCCSVMRQQQRTADIVVSEKASDGARFTIRYHLPR